MKNFFRLCLAFLVLILANSLCIGIENIENKFKCNHLNDSEKSYTITYYLDEKPSRECVLCSQCAKEQLIKRLKKWMNLDKTPTYYCGLLRPKKGLKIKYIQPTQYIDACYKITPAKGDYFPDTTIMGIICPEKFENDLAPFCEIDLTYNVGDTEAKVYTCHEQSCKRYTDLIEITKGLHGAKNINYQSGQCYLEARECIKKGHIKLDYSIKLNENQRGLE